MVFFPKVLAFFLKITNIWQKSRDFLFADFFSGFLRAIGRYEFFLWIFGCLECVSSMYCLTFTKSVNTKIHLQKHFCIIERFLVSMLPSGGGRQAT
jgi:hypothetical protein